MPKFEVCDPDYDDTVWKAVEADDAAEAGESYVKGRCERDADTYSAFSDPGAVVLVRGGGRTVPVRVTVEMVPAFTGRLVE